MMIALVVLGAALALAFANGAWIVTLPAAALLSALAAFVVNVIR